MSDPETQPVPDLGRLADDLSQSIAALAAVGQADLPGLLARIDALAAKIAALEARISAAPEAQAGASTGEGA
jgi:uncharacterized protein involved in exopolysaccharide biosynthesis